MTGILDKLNPLYTQIANGLGELAGNEAFWDTIEHNFPTGRRVDPPPHSRMFTAEFPVPGPHGFTLTHAYWGADFTQEGQPPPIETERALAKAAEQAWFQAAKGYSADAGWDTVLRNWGIDVWEADPSAMSGSVDGLVSVAHWLHDQLEPEAGWVDPDNPSAPAWLANLKKQWPTTSESSSTFFEFWTDVNDKCALYLDAAQRLAATSAQVTATVNDFQTNLLEVTRKTRDHVKTALEQWQQWKCPSGAWPTGEFDSQEGAKTILGYTSYATGVIALIPPAAVVSGVISVFTGGLSYVLADKVAVMEATSAAKAIDIWISYYNDVNTVCDNMRKALDGLHTQPQESSLASGSKSFQSYVAMVKADHRDWAPPEVIL